MILKADVQFQQQTYTLYNIHCFLSLAPQSRHKFHWATYTSSRRHETPDSSMSSSSMNFLLNMPVNKYYIKYYRVFYQLRKGLQFNLYVVNKEKNESVVGKIYESKSTISSNNLPTFIFGRMAVFKRQSSLVYRLIFLKDKSPSFSVRCFLE